MFRHFFSLMHKIPAPAFFKSAVVHAPEEGSDHGPLATFDLEGGTQSPYISLSNPPHSKMHAYPKAPCHGEHIIYKHSFKHLSLSHILFVKDPPLA